MEKLIEKAKENILENRMLGKGDSILVAFSGGPDSTALVFALHELAAEMNFALGACYVNHMIRPKAVKKEIEFCWSVCDRFNIDFNIINEDIPMLARESKQSIETAAREFRLAVLKQLADDDGYAKIALGHNLDDLIETVLFRLFRGTGPQGLDPIKPITGEFIRPLYNIPRREIEMYLKKIKVTPMIDKSNLESKYSRNYIRNKIIPRIEKHFGDKYKNAIFNFSRIISLENQFLNDITGRELKKIIYITPGGKIVVDSDRLRTYDVWLKRRLLKLVFEKLYGYPGAGSFSDVENIEEVISGKKKAVNLSGDTRVVRERSFLFFIKDKVSIGKSILPMEGSIKLSELGGKINCKQMPVQKAITGRQKDGYKVNIDFDKISMPLHVRRIRPGDKFSPLGMKGAKKVGDFLTDRKISKYIRDEIPLVSDKKGIIWLVGLQIADRVKIDKTTRRILDIEYIGKKGQGNSQIRSALFSG